jgi:3',5'-cyclic-AMP phosphodiesterase
MRGGWLLAQISDLHIGDPGSHVLPALDTAPFLSRAIEQLNSFDPAADLVIATGDLVNDGQPSQYEHLRSLLAPLAVPIVLTPGNHDDIDALRAVMGDLVPSARPRCDRVIDGEPRLICLDSTRFPEASGALDDDQLQWFTETLAENPDVDTVVALHHPPFVTGISHMDAMALDAPSAAALAEIVWANPQIERVLCGHVHRTVIRRWAGTLAMTAPSVAHAVAFDLRPDAPAAWALEPPAIALHRWEPGEGVVTHIVPIGDFPATPYDD